MSKISSENVVEELTNALEVLAFVSPEPTDDRCQPPEAVLCGIQFTGSFEGELKMIAPKALGNIIAANILGTEPSDEQTDDRAIDSLREIMNVTCGAICSRVAPNDRMELSLPSSQSLESQSAWQSAIANPQTQILAADGHLLAIWMEEAA